jgi:hypothetical protein
MQQKKLPLIIILVLFPFLIKAEWIPLNKQNTSPAPPNVTLISDDNTSTVLKIEISGFDLKNFSSEGNEYQLVDLLTESFITKPGFPKLPYIAKVLAIPDQAAVSVEILETGDVQTFQNVYLPPARTSWLEGEPETPYTENIETYSSNNKYPNEFVRIDPPSVFRDFRIARVSVFPIRYMPAKKEIQVASSITVRINYGSGKVINPKNTLKKPIAPSFGQLYKDFIFNYQSTLDNLYGGKEEGHELMLCIMPDEFFASFQTYADWKRQSGIDIHITKFSDIGANSTNPVIIKNHIADAYHNWEVPPTYVLIVGDNGVFPKQNVTLDGWTFPNEDYFVEIDGDDFFPEMMIGRLTNESDYGMQVMLNKFTKYEKTPYTTSTDWFKKGICCSNNYYASQVETKRFAAERMLTNGGFTSVDTMMSDPGCTYQVSDVVNAINNGRSYLNYRGEGWSSGWNSSCAAMHTSDVSGLANGQKLTFVTSIGCGVAMFNTSGGNCFGEEWLELGTISSPRGAVAFVGPTSNTHTTYNNKIDKGIYIGMFNEGLNTPGQALARGKLYLYNVYGTDPYVEYHYKIYCVLGDPSVHIWKDVPQNVSVDYPSTITFGSNLVEYTVTQTSGGAPVANAVVCVTGNNIFVTGITDATGKAYLDITAEVQETLTVTVTGGNVYPFEGTQEVIPPAGPWVMGDYYSLDDNAGGNGNSLMDYGESILLSLAVKNVGTTEASNVNVVLSTTDPYITITDNMNNYGSIPADQSVLATNAYAFTVANDIPDEHTVIINIAATMGITTWNSYLSITGHAPVLTVGTLTISDPDGNNNGLLDPGESVTITVSVSNDGHSISPEATANLNSTSSFITLNNTSDILGPIDIGATEASFSVTVSPSAPMGESIDLDFDVIAGDYNASKPFVTSIGLMFEDWETGNFNKFPWNMGGDADWSLVTDNPHEGIYCARSGNIADSQVSDLEVTTSATSDGQITFFRKVSSEHNYDFLKFFIDGSQIDQWSGNVGWGQVSYPVTEGVHTYKWQYYKDYTMNSGEDCAWIDYIVFPFPTPPVFVTPPYQTEFEEAGSIPEGWINETGDDFDWFILSGPTPSNNTGPSGDHTTGSGYYMYTEATNPNNPNKRADLITPNFDLSSFTDVELGFWYHMYDNTVNNYMGTLHLDVFLNDAWIEDAMTPISGNQGDQWHEQVVDLTAYVGEIIKLRFRGITGSGYASDIAIDDFSIDGTIISPYLEVELKAFLEGPFKVTDMATGLNIGGLLPLSQPYNMSPWDYNGTESVSAMPSGVVDWVLVELRDDTSASNATISTRFARQAGLLLSNGDIVATDGSSPLQFDNSVSNSLFVVIVHRNHLAILSANELSLSGENYSYDFTTGSGQAYGTNSQKQFATGKWGMMSGDANADGTVEIGDLTPIWYNNAGNEGYYPADVNLDGQVDNMDKDSFCIPNTGKVTNVPQ